MLQNTPTESTTDMSDQLVADLQSSIDIAMSNDESTQTGTSGEGFSGQRVIKLLRELAVRFTSEKSCYLEIGVFRGLTLLSVAQALKDHQSSATVAGIDNFSQFDTEGTNRATVESGAAERGLQNLQLINLDYEEALDRFEEHLPGQSIGAYFVDGPHDYRSQLMCLLLARPFLAERSVIVIDDCNYPHVRLATKDFLRSCPEFKLVLEAYTPLHPLNASEAVQEEFRRGWWNGVHVLAYDPNDRLETCYPEVGDARQRCEDDHVIHAHKWGNHARLAMEFADYCVTREKPAFIKRIADLKEAVSLREHRIGNTDSKDLPDLKVNSRLSVTN